MFLKEVHSLSGDRIESEVRIRRECDRLRGTDILESASAETSQDTERMRPGEWDSRSANRDRIERGMSGDGKNATKRGELTF